MHTPLPPPPPTQHYTQIPQGRRVHDFTLPLRERSAWQHMEFGLSVTLDPQGGNQVNFRRIIRAAELKWGSAQDLDPAASGAEDEAEGSDASDSDPPAAAAAAPKTSKAFNEYDYDDDFIDDDDLYVEETRGSIANESSSAAAIMGDGEDLEFEPDAPIERDKPLPVVKLVDKAFYVNRGPIRPRITVEPLVRKARLRTRIHADSVPAPPPKPENSSKENLSKEKPASAPPKPNNGASSKPVKAAASKTGKKNTKNAADAKKKADGGKPKAAKSSAAKSGNSTPAKRPLKQQALTTSGKLSKSSTPPPAVSAAVAAAALASGESATKKRKVEGTSGTKKSAPVSKPLAPQVVAEVEKLRALCLEMFGDKKPILTDAYIQAQLTTLFEVALKHGCCKLYSDIGKDNRKLELSGELWSALSKFLRTTRQFLGDLGHALHWGAAEKKAVSEVEEATAAVSAAAMAAGDSAFVKGTFGAAMEEALQQYLRARTKRQNARNQLAAKARTVTARKAMSGWAGALKKGALAMCDVNEGAVLQALRKVDDRMNAAAKKKREEEKEARRKKKELPKNMADALPPALRNLASLKAKVGASAAGSAKPSSAAGGSKVGSTSASVKGGDGAAKKMKKNKAKAPSPPKDDKVEAKEAGDDGSGVKEVGVEKRNKKKEVAAEVIELE